MSFTLLIMAAGLGSRFGGDKQLVDVGPNGEAFFDFAIRDAAAAGATGTVIIVRSSIEDQVRQHLAKIHGADAPITLVCQDAEEFGPFRDKPWGTAHAIWSAKNAVDGPFVVVNADDYYGPSSFVLAAEALAAGDDKTAVLVAFELARTLPDDGTVSRGVTAHADGLLDSITETHKIGRSEDGVIRAEDPPGELADDTPVSMNMFGFSAALFDHLEEKWHTFYAAHKDAPKTEYLLPDVVDELRASGDLEVKVVQSTEDWIGVTNPQDLEPAREKLKNR